MPVLETDWPSTDTVVLRNRVLRAGTDLATLSRFGDRSWAVGPADPDAHTHHAVLRWHGLGLPEELVDQIRTLAFAMLDRTTPQVMKGAAADDFAAVGTVGTRIRDLLVFAGWLDELDIRRFCDVTEADLERFLEHVKTLPRSRARRSALLAAVRTLWAYGRWMPPEARLIPNAAPWGGQTPARLVGAVVTNRVNRTPRIAPATMEALLAWSLHLLEDAGPDVAAAWDAFNRLNARELTFRDDLDGMGFDDRLTAFLDQTARDGESLPGWIEDGRPVVNFNALSKILGMKIAWHEPRKERVLASGLPIDEHTRLGPIAGRIAGRPWRSQQIGVTEIRELVRLLTAACFILVCYLSGARPGEVLNLRRGCRHVDPETGELQIGGRRGKGRGRSNPGTDQAQQRSWTVVAPVHAAVGMLETLTDGDFLFPASPGRAGMPNRPSGVFPRSAGGINRDLELLVAWVNTTFGDSDGALPIPPDPTRHIHAARFRRTLAYFIVRRRRGLVAAALQYGHVSTKVTLSYSGMADVGWLDDLALERLELVLEQADSDWGILQDGETVSGPSAADYRMRVGQAARFAGRVVNTPRGARRLLEQVDPNIHHGEGMTCVWRKETALCRKAKLDAGLPDEDAPDESECRTACQNLAYTDRDIAQLRDRAAALDAAAADTLAPQPIRTRKAAQADILRRIITRHEMTAGKENDK